MLTYLKVFDSITKQLWKWEFSYLLQWGELKLMETLWSVDISLQCLTKLFDHNYYFSHATGTLESWSSFEITKTSSLFLFLSYFVLIYFRGTANSKWTPWKRTLARYHVITPEGPYFQAVCLKLRTLASDHVIKNK